MNKIITIPVSKEAIEQIDRPLAILVYIALVKLANWQTLRGKASDIQIAEIIKISARQVGKERKWLQEHRWIKWYRQYNKQNIYQVYQVQQEPYSLEVNTNHVQQDCGADYSLPIQYHLNKVSTSVHMDNSNIMVKEQGIDMSWLPE